MRRILLTVEYHGAGFFGWQRQGASRSVQGTLEVALQDLMGAADIFRCLLVHQDPLAGNDDNEQERIAHKDHPLSDGPGGPTSKNVQLGDDQK